MKMVNEFLWIPITWMSILIQEIIDFEKIIGQTGNKILQLSMRIAS